jgi:hypothetical protein
MSRWQVWINDSTLAGHVDADSDVDALELALRYVNDFYGGNIPVGIKWSVCEIPPGYYKEITDSNIRSGFNAQTDF